MNLPVKLSGGIMSVYGSGSLNGIDITNSPKLQFGVINLLPYDYGEYALGQNVLFNIDDTNRVMYNNVQYFLIAETKIILTEDDILPP
jgi:hypothetical protein